MKGRIYKPTKNAMQSGRGGRCETWVLEYETATPRVPESLMGWVSSGDTLNQVTLRFPCLEDAQAFAVREGISCTVQIPQPRRVRPRNYADNFRYDPADEQGRK